MKVIDVSEVMNAVEISMAKKKTEKEQVLKIRDSIHGILDLGGALEGEMGKSVKEHFISFHIPVILLLNQFLADYQKKLNKVKSIVLDYETEGAIVRQAFIENDMEQGLDRVKIMLNQSIGDINGYIASVSDLASVMPLSDESLMYRFDDANRHNRKTVEDLLRVDKDGAAALKEASDNLKQIVQLIQKLNQWAAPANIMKEETITEIESYFSDNEKLSKLMDGAIETSIKDGASTTGGDAANVLGTLSNWTGIKAASEGVLTAAILLSKRIMFHQDGKGNYTIRSHPNWKQVKNEKYNSKLASVLYTALKKGSDSSVRVVKDTFSKFKNAPSNVLKVLIGLEPGTTRRGYAGILNERFRFIRFAEEKVKSYDKFPIDVKKTVGQFKTIEGMKQVIRRVPFVGIVASIGTNSGEFYSDENKYKSGAEKTGRFAAGVGLDLGVAGLTSGGAVIGSMICPGPGTIIGGAIGAAIGIAGSMAAEKKVKAVGENAVKWIVDTFKDAGESVRKGKKIVANLFR
ncbi:MAG: T7SS effector LXG polymorphic toxin [Bacillus sp. (in: firmicutes)]